MVSKLRKIRILYFLFFVISGYAQKAKFSEVFKKFPETVCQKHNSPETFHKAHTFFFENKLDSALLYSDRFINKEKSNNELLDCAFYIKAQVLVLKGILQDAEQNFLKISDAFPYAYLKYIKLGGIYTQQNKFEQALTFYKKWEVYYANTGNDYNKKEIYHNIGLCYLHTQKHDLAEKYLKDTYKLQIEDKDSLGMGLTLMDLANVYYDQYKDDLAIPMFQKAYKLSKKVNDFEFKQNAALNMAVVAENQKQLAQSLQYRKEYEQWKDSLWNRDKVWSLAKQQKEFAVKEKQQEVQLLQLDKKYQEAELKSKSWQRNLFIVASVMLLLFLAIGAYFYRQRVKQKKDLAKLNDTKNRLFSIVSHDLRSPVNAIQKNNAKLGESIEGKNLQETQQLVINNKSITDKVYLMLDNVLNWSLDQSEQLHFSMETIPAFILLQPILDDYQLFVKTKQITLETEIPKNVKVAVDRESLKIILRNLLDNAFKYTNEGGKITVSAETLNENYTLLKVADTGIGMDDTIKNNILQNKFQTQQNKNSTGLGLYLTKTLIDKNQGTLEIQSQKEVGTTFTLKLKSC
ncbi:tetratricopeptide repeat-containing sensor histidine kinase [uncultured Kordia sp.]|uniref:tetratricopeptide repeat-containing sensor histidine kinase n=1 Tax=uncultured Kordia sp. TaxID=507699 RepID=UPI002619445B|nr:tetratricopeptide repeat-containing sensor histidine kinase [uncultured Kordia sp.]